jgi:hypothetical protein
MKTIQLACAALLLATACTQTPEKRAQKLIAQLTIEEKASLMMHDSQPVEALGAAHREAFGKAEDAGCQDSPGVPLDQRPSDEHR